MFFGSPAFLWLLLLLPAYAFYLVRFKRRGEPALGYPSLAHLHGMGDRAAAAWERIRGWARLGALALLIIALARPQQGLKGDDRFTKAADIMLCLDASDSMRAEDFKPRNRIEVAKESAIQFLEKRRDDRLGLVVFGRCR